MAIRLELVTWIIDAAKWHGGKMAFVKLELVSIPNEINGVAIEFAGSVNRQVTRKMLAAMNQSISSNINGNTVEKLWVSSAKDSHNCPSRHVSGNGVDISRVNGKYISVHYRTDETVRGIVDGLQNKFESADHRRENYGPTIKKKEGVDRSVPGHADHFHWSVNGDHSVCSYAFIANIRFYWNKLFGKKEDEICDI